MSGVGDARGVPSPLAQSPASEDGLSWARLWAHFFDKIEIEPEGAENLRSAYERGVVVHTLRSPRLVDPAYLRFLLPRLGLPELGWSHENYRSEDEDNNVADLITAVQSGTSALLFLKRTKTLLDKKTALSQRHIEALVAQQRTQEKPILLLPESLLWNRRAVGLRKTILSAFFGDRDSPGRVREVSGFFWHYQSSRFHVGAPIDLAAVIERESGSSDRIIAKKVRWSLLHHLTREEQIRTGPMQRSAARIRQNVLKDPTLRRHIQRSAEKGESRLALDKQADVMLRGIAADMRYGWLRVLDAVVDLVWHRIYDGIVVDPEGLALVRRAARRGPVVLVPSHKSHVDYLVLSQVFFKDNMIPPHIAAGDNLNFWPMGHIFRRSGAFFIRRGFKGNKLYAQVFGAYVRRLLKEGHAVEFFIEGSRSRTGKLLSPRTGMLSMCVEPVLEGSVSDVQYVPVSISYEKVVEAKSYARELQGGKKRKEDVTSLLSSAKVLRSKYGRVYVDFAEPISLRVFAASRGVDLAGLSQDEGLAKPVKRNLVTQLSHRIVYGINLATRVTPTSVAALILLARTRRGLAQNELFERAERVIEFLTALDARISGSLKPENMQAALREALGRFAGDKLLLMPPASDGETIYQVMDEGRRALDYYKNNILHFFVPHAIVCLAIIGGGGQDVPHEEVLERALRLSKLLKFEFSFRVGPAFGANFEATTATLIKRRTIEHRAPQGEDRGHWSTTTVGKLEAHELAGLLAVFIEAYRLAAETLEDVDEAGLPTKQFLELALQRGSRQILEGRILRAEAAAQALMKTALSTLSDRKIIGKGGTIEVLDETARQAFIAELTEYLPVDALS